MKVNLLRGTVETSAFVLRVSLYWCEAALLFVTLS